MYLDRRWLEKGRLKVVFAWFVTGAVLVSPAVVQAESKKYGDLLKRVPTQANAVLLVDMDAVLDSAVGKREKWRDAIIDRPTALLGVSSSASKGVVAVNLDPRTLDERWKVAMVQTKSEPPKPSVLANREGGYVEEIEAQKVIWTPRDLYLFSFEPQIVGYVVPADRQMLVDWLTTILTKPRTFPPSWADRAIFRADAGSPVVYAMNLKDVVSVKEVERWLKSLPGMKAAGLDATLTAPLLASVKSAIFEIEIDQTVHGKIQVEFEKNVEPLAQIAKEILFTALDDVGAALGDDVKKWEATTRGNTIVLEGALDIAALKRLLSIASTPSLSTDLAVHNVDAAAETLSDSKDAAVPTRESKDGEVVKASQAYYRAIVDITDSIRQKRTSDWSHIRVWMDRAARQIDELPILYVDTDLLDWGAQVSRSLRGMSQGINYANKNRSYQYASGSGGAYGGYYGWGGGSGLDARLMKTQTNSMISVGIDQSWKDFENSTADMRKKLVTKYKVDF